MLIFVPAFWSFGQSVSGDYAFFTSERQSVLAQMGEFFDRTVRENFPSEHDTLSYKRFLRCIAVNGDRPLILVVDRDRLKAINRILFRDENYYFFYSRYLTVPIKDVSEISQYENIRDSVPTIRNYIQPQKKHMLQWWYVFPHNPDGYIRLLVEREQNNPFVLDMATDMATAGDFSITLFMSNLQFSNLREISRPMIKELIAVVFWQHLCFCGGVDLVNRKSFCDPCNLSE
jgi:hypothetical protein